MDHNEHPQHSQTISIKQFCQLSGMCKTTTHKLINSGQLKSTKVLGRRLILRNSAQALIAPETDRKME